MKHLLIVILLSMVVATASAPDYETRDAVQTIENEDFKIKLVSEYPSKGLLEALTKVGENEKRIMVLRIDTNSEMRRTCNVLYYNSRTVNRNPCYLLNQ